MNFFSVLFISIVYLVEKSFGEILFNQINTNINWIYLTKFYFHAIDGHIDINLQSIDNNVLKVFVLGKVDWKNDLSQICLRKDLMLNQENNETDLSISFTDINRMYLIISQCNSSVNVFDTTYKIILTNGNNLFTEQFSNNERGILALFIISTSIYTIFFLIVLRYVYISRNKSCLIIKFYLMSIFCSWLNSLISFIFSLIFALTGNNQTILYRLLVFFSRFFDFIAQILFLLVLILCAKGYLIIRIQLKRKTMLKIKFLIVLYTLLQIIILILITIAINQIIPNENLVMICDCIQMIMYLLSCLWFILSLLFTTGSSNKEFHCFLICLIWFLTNAIVILLNILDVLPSPQITILRTIQIGVQFLTYRIFQFIIRNKTFFLRTKLNQINITYIDPSVSKSPIKEASICEQKTDTKSNELMNLCLIENTWASRFRMPIRSLEPLPRLEPRRDTSSKTLTKSSMNTSQPSVCNVPRRLPSLNHDDQ